MLDVLMGNLRSFLHLPTRSVASPALAVNTWLRELQDRNPCEVRGHIAIFAARNPTWVEWAIYAAFWMRSMGLAPVLIFSGKEIRNVYRGRSLRTRMFNLLHTRGLWEAASKIPDLVLCDVDREPEPDANALAAYDDFARDWGRTSAAYDMYVEEDEEGPLREEYLRRLEVAQKGLAWWGAKVEVICRRLVQQYKIERLLAYSGLIGMTSAVGESARRAGLDVVFSEGWSVKPGIMIANLNAPALDWDPRLWLKHLDDWDESQSKIMDRFLEFQETNDVTDVEWLQGHLQYQRSSVNQEMDGPLAAFLDDERPLFLMAPNVIADSGTMRRPLIFRSQRHWIQETCRYFREHPNYKVIIRAHPAEWRMRQKVKIQIGDVAREAAAGASNIFVIGGEENTSTYALIPYACAGIVWLSNVGVDMVIRGCPVISTARAKYRGLGITLEPKSVEEYFSLLSRLGQSRLNIPPESKDIGKKYLSILYRERSFEAFGRGYRASDLHLTGHPADSDFDRFYRILAGDLPIETRPSNCEGSETN